MRGRSLRRLAVIAAAVACVGCKPRPATDPQPTGATAASSGADAPVSGWTQAGGGPARTGMTTEPGPRAMPGIRWTNPLERDVVTEPVLGRVGGKPVVLMGSGNEVLAFDLETGKTAWSHRTESIINACPAQVGDSVWTVFMDGFVLRLSAADGQLAQELEFDFTLEASPLLLPGLMVFEETSYSANVQENRLHAIDPATGTGKWATDFASATGRSASSDGQRIFVGASDAILAFDAATGKPAWTHAFPVVTRVYTPMVSGGRVLVARGSYGPGTIEALDAATGKPAWTRQLAGRIATQPVATDTEILLPMMDGKIERVLIADGTTAGLLDPGGRCDARPVLSPERLYVPVEHAIVAFDRATWQRAWTVELESQAPPGTGILHLAVMGTRLVAVRLDGFMHVLEAPDGT